MSEPTKAQVEAAAKAIADCDNPADWNYEDGDVRREIRKHYRRLARAALQAAAVTSCCCHQRYDVTPPTPSHPQPSVSPDDT